MCSKGLGVNIYFETNARRVALLICSSKKREAKYSGLLENNWITIWLDTVMFHVRIHLRGTQQYHAYLAVSIYVYNPKKPK